MTAETSWIVGSSPDCDIRVDSPTVSGRHCRLTQRGESYLLEDLQSTNGTFVGDERITGPRIISRGDPVSLGQDTSLPWPRVPISISVGRSPDNDVVIPFEAVSAHHARVERDAKGVLLVDLGSTNGTAINDPSNKITRAPLKPTDFVFLGTHRIAATDLLAALPDSPRQATTMPEKPRPEALSADSAAEPSHPRALAWPAAIRSGRSWLVGIALSIVVVVVLLGGSRLFRSRVTEMDEIATSAEALPLTPPQLDEPTDAGKSEPANAAPAEPSQPAKKNADAINSPAVVSAPPEDPWNQVLDKLRKAIFLLAVEDPKSRRTWPVTSACAIGENTLLTSGNMVTELARFKQEGWKLWAINEPSGIKLEIESLRVHIGYADPAGKPEERIFVDLGLVTVPARLSSLVQLASPAELAELELGFPLGCVGVEGVEHDVEPVTRFQSNEAELYRANVFDIDRLRPPPAPSLLIFAADLPIEPYGAALVNVQGKVCAVYAVSAESDGDVDLNLHYAPLIDGDLILGGSSTSSDLWVEPVVPKAETKPKSNE